MNTPAPVQVYLASTSPRRRELLNQIGVGFETLSVDVDETPLAAETPQDFVCRVALDKAREACQSLAGRRPLPVLGADTAVVLNGEIFGKPRDREHAMDMLTRLSGSQHEVLSAVALVDGHERVLLSHSRVKFRVISAAERRAYWDSGEPLDKAGAYAIQGLGAVFVSRLEGSYSGVMGLPLFETSELLREVGVDVLDTIRG